MSEHKIIITAMKATNIEALRQHFADRGYTIQWCQQWNQSCSECDRLQRANARATKQLRALAKKNGTSSGITPAARKCETCRVEPERFEIPVWSVVAEEIGI